VEVQTVAFKEEVGPESAETEVVGYGTLLDECNPSSIMSRVTH
jgi:hypothetical protein